MRESDSIVIIPTYNEMENIEKIIRAVFGLEKSFHIEMRQEVQQEVEHMCNLSQGVREDGRKEERNRIILNMLNMKKVLSDILEVTEASENDVLTLARENGLEVVR